MNAAKQARKAAKQQAKLDAQQAQADAKAAAKAANAMVLPDGSLNERKAKKDPEKAQAALIDAQRADFNSRYLPIENQLISMTDMPKEGDPNSPWAKAGTDAKAQLQLTRGEFNRNLAGTGTVLNAGQQQAVARKFDLAQARSVANAENMSRQNTMDQNTHTKADLIGIGRGVQGGANSGLADASSMAAARNSASDSAKQAQKAQNQNMIASMGGLAIGAAMLML